MQVFYMENLQIGDHVTHDNDHFSFGIIEVNLRSATAIRRWGG